LDSHLAEETILRLLDGEVSAEEDRRALDHLESCEACRHKVEAEGEFNVLLRRGLAREPAPSRLKRRIRVGLAAAAGEENHRILTGPRMAVAAAALIAMAGLLVILQPYFIGPWAPDELVTAGPGAAHGETAAAAGEWQGEMVSGHLVCIGCARHHVDMALHRFCRGGGDREHITGLQTSDGELWHFVENDVVTSLLDEPDLRGREVTLEARFHPDIHYLQVAAVREL
jgi:anti-sigma factor RsiW